MLASTQLAQSPWLLPCGYIHRNIAGIGTRILPGTSAKECLHAAIAFIAGLIGPIRITANIPVIFIAMCHTTATPKYSEVHLAVS